MISRPTDIRLAAGPHPAAAPMGEPAPRVLADWQRICLAYGIPLRRPEPDEVPLSESEAVHGWRNGVFSGIEPFADGRALEHPRQRAALLAAHTGG